MIDFNDLDELMQTAKTYQSKEQRNDILNKWIEGKQKEEYKNNTRKELRRRLEALCHYYIDLYVVASSMGMTDLSAMEDSMRDILDRLNEVK